MRIVMIFAGIVVYLFSLVYIESELVKIEVKNENLKNQVNELHNQKEILELEVISLSNLATIEEAAKKRGYIFPDEDDILGTVK
jgi:cell division protein FtsL